MSDEGKIVEFGGRPPSVVGMPQPSIIELLEDLMQQARAGRIQHIGAVWLTSDNVPLDAYAGQGNPQQCVTLIGSIELFKHTVLSQIKDQ